MTLDSRTGLEIGLVVEVTGERALAELTVDTTVPLKGDYYPGQPGSYVKIPFRDSAVIGTVSGVRAADGPRSPRTGAGESLPRRIASILMIGTIDNRGMFSRGVAVYPNVGQEVLMVSSRELNEVFSEYVHFGFSFGSPVQAPDQRAYIHVDRFFGRHTALLGTTGCGKSCTVATILQRAVKTYPDTHIVVLDLHGEYSAAFPNDVRVIEADKVELPYWMLDFEEFTNLTVDPTEFSYQNQLSVLRNAILQARQSTDRREGLNLGEAVTVDSPIYYTLDDMLGLIRGFNIQMVPSADSRSGTMDRGPLFGAFDRFMIRFEARQSDPRFRFMFSPRTYLDNRSMIDLLKEYLSIDVGTRMTIIDLSGIPSEAVGVVVAVVARVVFEFNLWNPARSRFPILMVFEEAHNYVPNRFDPHFTATKKAVERIAKEGRKYGIGMMAVSQRPKELDETVLSSCNTFVVMRTTNPEDQNYVRRLVPDSLAGMMDILPSLRTGEALVLGDALAMPSRILIDTPDPKPLSADVLFSEWWADGIKEMDVERVVRRWRSRQHDL
jgi:DNA helicase HerA-like ATPase